ncbi:hypothetical protein DFJ77DRAFT_77292 [Powellomyces hirtus]|nr:hypothetical protein DFJ77DRAFT_77292 [Powellomyces hirtus]
MGASLFVGSSQTAATKDMPNSTSTFAPQKSSSRSLRKSRKQDPVVRADSIVDWGCPPMADASEEFGQSITWDSVSDHGVEDWGAPALLPQAAEQNGGRLDNDSESPSRDESIIDNTFGPPLMRVKISGRRDDYPLPGKKQANGSADYAITNNRDSGRPSLKLSNGKDHTRRHFCKSVNFVNDYDSNSPRMDQWDAAFASQSRAKEDPWAAVANNDAWVGAPKRNAWIGGANRDACGGTANRDPSGGTTNRNAWVGLANRDTLGDDRDDRGGATNRPAWVGARDREFRATVKPSAWIGAGNGDTRGETLARVDRARQDVELTPLTNEPAWGDGVVDDCADSWGGWDGWDDETPTTTRSQNEHARKSQDKKPAKSRTFATAPAMGTTEESTHWPNDLKEDLAALDHLCDLTAVAASDSDFSDGSLRFVSDSE